MRSPTAISFPARRTLAAVLLTLLTACGGGGGGSASVTPSAAPAFSSAPALAPACADCAAADAGTYRGSGAGVWSYSNTSGQAVSVPVAIGGLGYGKAVTYILTHDASAATTQTAQGASASVAETTALHGSEMQEFNRIGWRNLAGPARATLSPAEASPPPVAPYAPGSVRSFHDKDNTLRTTSLVRRATASDGRVIQLWLEAGEGGASRITEAMLDQLLQSYAGQGGVYELAVGLGGPPWGPHNYPSLIAPAGQPLDIVLLNFNRDGQPMGLVGYFWARNAFRKTVEPYSNESVSVYLDTETAYLADDGLAQTRSVLAHETMHMLNFYRRNLVMGQLGYDTWLEEMTAMMLEDLLDAGTGGTRPPMLPRLYAYMTLGEYYCGLTGFKAPVGTRSCDGYALGGTYGAYLLRQYGVSLFRDLLAAAVRDGQALVDGELARRGTSLKQTTQRLQATVLGAMAPGEAPSGYGLPDRQDSGFALRALDPSRHGGSLQLSAAFPDDTAPAPGGALARRLAVVGSTLTDTVQVPPHTTLTVVIDNPPSR